jgi:glyoxylase-like metal-dependent hydrolase (beta-lactamase superfamily II)
MAYVLEDEFGDIIGKARHGLGLSVEETAAAAGLSAPDLRALEAYEHAPTETENRRLAEALQLEPAALWSIATEHWQPVSSATELEGGARLVLLPYPPMRVTMYVLGDTASNQALIVDPGAEPQRILAALSRECWQAVGILITHADGDHIGALADVWQASLVPVWVHADERPRLRGVDAAHLHSFDRDVEFALGPFVIRALETAGHAAGHTAYALRDAVFVGDTLFAGSVGRTSLGPEHYQAHLAAVRAQILSLPAATRLFPGHGPPTTVGEERVNNPFFAARDRA